MSRERRGIGTGRERVMETFLFTFQILARFGDPWGDLGVLFEWLCNLVGVWIPNCLTPVNAMAWSRMVLQDLVVGAGRSPDDLE
jgi:hypothetical protein